MKAGRPTLPAMTTALHPPRARIPASALGRIRVMFLAKHANSIGAPDPVDGNHALYHHELRTTLEGIGLDVVPADSLSALDRAPDVDFVIPLLNRAGFQNSEMLAPLQLVRHGIPHLGASPILRGMADDKHLSKLVARAHGVPTADWRIYRRGVQRPASPDIAADRLVVKPNASSASWGVRVTENRRDAADHVAWLHAAGHDAIVEEFLPQIDVAVPVVGGASADPWLLPAMAYRPTDTGRLRSYEEKRALVPTEAFDPLETVDDPALAARLRHHTLALCTELWPFDYGRFEFRYDPATDRLWFMEVNLSCNLWSRKTISRSAASIGVDHAMLVESIVAHSMARQGVFGAGMAELAA